MEGGDVLFMIGAIILSTILARWLPEALAVAISLAFCCLIAALNHRQMGLKKILVLTILVASIGYALTKLTILPL